MSNKKGSVKIILLLLVLLGVSVFTKGFSEINLKRANLDKIKTQAYDLINEKLMRGKGGFEIKEVTEENGMYKLLVKVNGQEITSYLSKDLTKFFPSMIQMKESKDAGEKTDQKASSQDIPQSETPEVQLFVMSFCPYGNQAEETMKPVVDLLGDKVDINVHYIFYANYQGGGSDYCMDDDSKYCSMHGANEANQDIRELCVEKNQKDKFWDFVLKVNKDCDAKNVEECWEDSADAVGVDVSQVKSCFDKNKLTYAEEEQKLTTELEVGGSPTLIINGVKFSGSRTPEGYKQGICSGFKDGPKECEKTLDGSGTEASGDCG